MEDRTLAFTSPAWSTPDSALVSARHIQSPEERLEERWWLDRCAEGDERAIRWVLNRYRDRVVRLAAHVLHNRREAEDVAQEAFVKAFRQISRFRGDSGFYGWLYRIVVNVCLDRMRRRSSSSELPLDESSPASQPTHAFGVEMRVAVAEVLDTLSPTMRAALVLRELEGLEYADIAAVLQVPIGTVRSRLNAARAQFRRRWAAIEEETRNV